MKRAVKIPAKTLKQIHTAVLDHQGEVATIRAEMGNAAAECVTTMIGFEKDIDIGGPFSAYLQHLRSEMTTALEQLPELDATNTEAIRKVQSAVRGYRDALEWLATTFEIGTGELAVMDAQAEAQEDEYEDA